MDMVNFANKLLKETAERQANVQKFEQAYHSEPGRCPHCNSRKYSALGYCSNCGHQERETQYKDHI